MRTLARIVTFSFQSISRNVWLSFVTTSIMVLTLVTVNAVVFLNVIGNAAIASVEDRVRVTVYFNPGTSTAITDSVRGYLTGLPQVKTVNFIDADAALATFKDVHRNDPNVLAALDVLDANPFGPAVSIAAESPDDYAFILTAVESPEYKPYIKDKDYADYADVLARLSSFSDRLRFAGYALAIFFALIATLITFNTIRVAIYVHRDEIGIMKLVGANDWFVRGPFLLEAIVYALLATGIMVGIVALVVNASAPYISTYFAGIPLDIPGYYLANGVVLFSLQFLGLAFLGLVTTWFAMRKYLRV